jgi:uncharacterized protein (TIGR01777 family)
MGFELSCRLDAPVEDVFAWHGRPGAIHRLLPPWQPVRVVEEAQSLADGRAVLAMPLGLRWVAEHQPDQYEPDRRFVDVLTTPVLREVLGWSHAHEFSPEAGGSTVLTDRVRTTLPSAVFGAMFAYRCRQLTGDLASHRLAGSMRPGPMTVAVSGSSGLIGSALSAMLSTGGHRVVRLVRGDPRGPDERRWDVQSPSPGLLQGVDAVVHLAGASIAGRFTPAHKRAISESRIDPTRALASASAASGVEVFVCASAIGYYGSDRGDELLTEDSGPGDGFLAGVVSEWESATEPAGAGGTRVVLVRTGIVQTPRGGALRLQRPLFEIGAGGRLGSGRQWLAWIGIDDLLDIYLRALVDPSLRGAINAAAPQPVRNSEYAATLARVLRRPALIPVPGLGPRVLLGDEGAREIAEASQRVVPARLEAAGHRFRHPDLESALRHLLGRTGL